MEKDTYKTYYRVTTFTGEEREGLKATQVTWHGEDYEPTGEEIDVRKVALTRENYEKLMIVLALL